MQDTDYYQRIKRPSKGLIIYEIICMLHAIYKGINKSLFELA